MKVALFGGTGFVGSYIIDELLKNGHEPVVLVRKVQNQNLIIQKTVELFLAMLLMLNLLKIQ